ncbi:MAG: hypothetical protein HF312_17055 [Ignavibacteria bacterium]|jgi:hypothetical protein|nr:hypothetical protein [Ignavibacteria bacterium]
MDNVVSRDVCKVVHKAMDENIEEMKGHMQKIDESIASLSKISEQNQTIIEILMEERELRMTQTKSPHVWSQPWFKYIVVTGCIVLLILVLGVTSASVVEKTIQVLGKMPK